MKGKTTYFRRPLSFAVAMTMLLANMFGAGMVMAEEASSEISYYDDTGPEELVPETEEMTYSVNLPWMEGCLYTYDQTHQLIPEGELEQEKQDVILNYRKNEEVKIGILISDLFDVTELHLYNSQDETIDREEPAYTWDTQKRELDFFMPEEDLFLELNIEERVVEPQLEEVGQAPVTGEKDSLMPNELLYLDSSVNSSQGTPEPVADEQGITSGYEETAVVSESEKVQTYEMVLEMDGLPTQGSIIQMETMTIPYDTWDFNPEIDFTNITFSTEENEISYISDDIDYVNPGVYSSIYRVQQRSTERMWYVLRPVRVAEPVVESRAAEEQSSEQSKDNAEGEETADDADPDGEDIQASTELPAEEPETGSGDVTTSFDLYKVNVDNESEKLEGMVFRLFSSSDQEAEKARQIAEEVEALRAEQQLTVNAANIEAATAIGSLLQECDSENDEIRENYARKLSAYQEEGGHSEEEILVFKEANEEELDEKLKEKRTEHEAKIRTLMAEQKEAAQALSERNDQAVRDLEARLMEELQITDFSMLGTEFTTDQDGHYHQNNLMPGVTYFLYEISTLPGFNLDTSQYEFQVDENGLINGQKNYVLTLTNQPNRVEISKKSSSGELLAGAQMEIRSIGEDGRETIVESWTTDEAAHKISKLPAGNYTLHEISAPTGYALAPVLSFTVENSPETKKITMVDDQLVLHAAIKDISKGAFISGAELAVISSDGVVVDQWITTEEVHTLNLPEGDYLLKETVTPERYVTAEPLHFTVDAHMTEQDIIMYNNLKAEVMVSKQDENTKKEVSGALLAIYDREGNEIVKWISGEEAHPMLLAPGEYTLKELAAPAGYATSEPVIFVISEDGYKKVQSVIMYGTPLKVSISKRDLITDELLSGAKLVIKDKDKKVVEEWVSKGEEKEFFLEIGAYTLTEVTAPTGYEVAETITFEVLDTREVQNVVMYDAPKEELINLTGKKKETITDGNTQVTDGVMQNGSGEKYISAPVKTGDYTNFLLPGMAMVLSGATVIVLLVVRRRKNRTNSIRKKG